MGGFPGFVKGLPTGGSAPPQPIGVFVWLLPSGIGRKPDESPPWRGWRKARESSSERMKNAMAVESRRTGTKGPVPEQKPRRKKKRLKMKSFQQQKPAPQKKTRKRRHRRGRKTLSYLLFGIVGAMVLTVLCYTVFFKVYRITAKGDLGKYTQQEIVAASGIKLKDSLFQVDQNKVFALITSQLPYVQSVQVKKRFPTTVELQVTLSQPIGALERDGLYTYIDADGKILESGLEEYDKQYPLLRGLPAASGGAYAVDRDAEQLVMLRALKEALDKYGLDKISLISIQRLNMRLLYDDRVLIELGTEADLDYKIQFAQNTIKTALSPGFKGVLDLTMVEKWGVSWEVRNLKDLLEEDEPPVTQQPQDPAADGEGAAPLAPEPSQGKSGIVVDPETGDILVGPADPLHPDDGGSTGSSGQESGSSSEGGTSQEQDGGSASAPASGQDGGNT